VDGTDEGGEEGKERREGNHRWHRYEPMDTDEERRRRGTTLRLAEK